VANRRISDLPEIAGSELAEEDLFTVVHVFEVDPALKNKKLTVAGTKQYFDLYYFPRTGGIISGNASVSGDFTIDKLTTTSGLIVTNQATVSGLIVQNSATVSGTISGITITGGTIQGSNINGTTITATTVNATSGNFTNFVFNNSLISVALGSAASPSISFSGDSNTGIYSPGANNVALTTDGTERVRIDSSGNVGIGTTNPTAPLEIRNPTYSFIKLNGTGSSYPTTTEIDFQGTNTNNYIYSDGSELLYHAGYHSSNGNTGGFHRWMVAYNGGFGIEKARVNINGLTFNGDNAAANALDDYEEGTWTPNQGAGLTIVGSFTSIGRYTKIGRFVHVQFLVNGSTSIACTAAGIVCTKLPFTAQGGIYFPGSATSNNYNVSTGGMAFNNTVYNFESFSAAAGGPHHYSITYNID
jgi:hypothetical protein